MRQFIFLRRNGHVLTPSSGHDHDLMMGLKEGEIYRGKLTKPRNKRAHNLFFVVVDEATSMWPEKREPNPEGDSELLRAWLLWKAGHARSFRVSTTDKDTVVQIINALIEDEKYFFISDTLDDDGVLHHLFNIPNSMDYDHMDEDAFAPIRQECFNIIESVLRCKIETLMQHAELVTHG